MAFNGRTITLKCVIRLLVREEKRLNRLAGSIRRLVPGLLHFSTFNWLLGGLALIAVANGLAPNARLATALLVGSSYLYGALGNLWATRGRHPGWVLYTVALALIVYGANKPVAYRGAETR
jgi:hypothetical protein